MTNVTFSNYCVSVSFLVFVNGCVSEFVYLKKYIRIFVGPICANISSECYDRYHVTDSLRYTDFISWIYEHFFNIIISLLMSPLLRHRPSLWITQEENWP
jgi:hypothetical protein